MITSDCTPAMQYRQIMTCTNRDNYPTANWSNKQERTKRWEDNGC